MNWLEKKKLMTVFNKAMAKAKASPNSIKLQDRIRKAFGILQHHDYYVEEKAKYQPTFASCGCPDWTYRNAPNRDYNGHCKHMIAEILLARMNDLTFVQEDFLGIFDAAEEKEVKFTGKIWGKSLPVIGVN